MAENLNSAIKPTGINNTNCLPEQWLLRNVPRPPGETQCWESVPTQALHPHLWLINTILGLSSGPVRTTVTALGSPGAANYFANSREQYFAHSQQQRRASSVALLHLPLCGAVLQGFDDKGLGSTTSQQRDSKRQAVFPPSRTCSTERPLITIFTGFCFPPWSDKALAGLPAPFPSLPSTKRRKMKLGGNTAEQSQQVCCLYSHVTEPSVLQANF